jgi:hypothetical protein
MNADSQALVNALRGPIVLITIGVLFLMDKFTPYQFGQTWPVLLIVLGVLALAGSGRRYREQGPGMPPPPPPPGGRR